MWQSLEGWWPQPGFGGWPTRQPAWSHEQTSTCQRLLHQVEQEARSKLGFENIVLRNEKCQYWLPYKEIHSAPDHWSSNSKVVLQARMETVIREEKLSSKMDSNVDWISLKNIKIFKLTFSFLDQDWVYKDEKIETTTASMHNDGLIWGNNRGQSGLICKSGQYRTIRGHPAHMMRRRGCDRHMLLRCLPRSNSACPACLFSPSTPPPGVKQSRKSEQKTITEIWTRKEIHSPIVWPNDP